MAITKCNSCDNRAIFRSDGISYCGVHLPKSIKGIGIYNHSCKKMKVFCKSCNQKFYRNSKRGKFCESCIKQRKQKAVERMREKWIKKIEENSFSIRRLTSSGRGHKSQLPSMEKDISLVKDLPKLINKKKWHNPYTFLLEEEIGDNPLYEGVLKFLPKFYNLICNISSDNRCPWHAKILVNSALAYLVLNKDIIPDSNGPEGYLDDLFICAYVLKEIRDKVSKKIILDNISDIMAEEEVYSTIYEVLNKSYFYLGDRAEEVLSYIGIEGLDLFEVMEKNRDSYFFEKSKKKLKLIYALLAIKANPFMSKNYFKKSSEHLKKYIHSSPYFSELNRYMNFINDERK